MSLHKMGGKLVARALGLRCLALHGVLESAGLSSGFQDSILGTIKKY